jgi:hypothetical protein
MQADGMGMAAYWDGDAKPMDEDGVIGPSVRKPVFRL